MGGVECRVSGELPLTIGLNLLFFVPGRIEIVRLVTAPYCKRTVVSYMQVYLYLRFGKLETLSGGGGGGVVYWVELHPPPSKTAFAFPFSECFYGVQTPTAPFVW